MIPFTTPRPIGWWAAIASLLLLGCQDDPDAIGGHTPGGTGFPGIYVDQRIEGIDGDANPQREAYLAQAAHCEAAGMMSQALTAGEVDLIGTTRLQRWIESGRAAWRAESWQAASLPLERGTLCHFTLVSSGAHVVVEPDRTRAMSLSDNEIIDRPHRPVLLQRQASQSTGRQEPGAAGGQRQEIAGQACEQRELPAFPGASVCTWTGGAQWGFAWESPQPIAIDHAAHLMGRIVLSQEPGRGIRERVHTTRMSIGDVPAEGFSPQPATAWPSGLPLP